MKTISTVPSKIQVGDKVIYYGVTFEITGKRFSCHHNMGGKFGPDRPCYYLETKLVEYPESGSVMPRSWAAEWIFQGNDFATWAKVA